MTTAKKTRKPNRLQWVRVDVVAYPPNQAVYYFKVKRAGCNPYLGWALTGDARSLFEAYREGVAPLGILLDRLQECPEEAMHGIPRVVLEAIEFVRVNGLEVRNTH